MTTEKYLRRLDTTRIYREAYQQAGLDDVCDTDAEFDAEFDREFAGEAEPGVA